MLVKPGDVFEIRILNPRYCGKSWAPRVISGYFNSVDTALQALSSLALASAKGFYVTMNPVDPSLAARSFNRFADGKGSNSTGDKDIVSRRWLLIDCDPKRPSGISATDAEKEMAEQKAKEVREFLTSQNWPDPVYADSGNGYHLLYEVDLPVDDTGTIKNGLHALDKCFSDDCVEIDTTVFNSSRITKLYGTLAGKGDDCPEMGRPHRMSTLLNVPDEMTPVANELLEALAKQSTSSPLRATPVATMPSTSKAWDKDRLQQFVDEHLSHCSPQAPVEYDDGYKWVLGICPFDENHDDRSAVIVIKKNGMLGFRCHHNGCDGKNWKALRAKFDPPTINSGILTPLNQPELASIIEVFGPPLMVNKDQIPTDVNQMCIAAKYAADNLILFDPITGMFYSYDEATGLWRPQSTSVLINEIGHCFNALLKDFGALNLLKKRSESMLAQIMRLLRGQVEEPEVFRRKRNIIHVGNGVLHIDDEPPSFHPFSPDYHSRNRSEIVYDEHAQCPKFLEQLLQPALSSDDLSLLQRFAGQCLLGCNPSQKILLLRGTPGGGKSTLATIIESIIGTYNVMQLRVQHLGDRFEIASYVGKTLLTGKDVKADFLNNKSAYVLKALVGGDRLNAEQKNMKHRFEIDGDFNVLITSNSRLHVKLDSDSGAWRRRLMIIDYTQAPTSKPVPYFAKQLVDEEGSGILNWCIEGAVKLLVELDQFGSLQLTTNQTDRVEALLCESDSVRYFVLKCTSKSNESDVTISELQAAYNDFCELQGWQAVSTTPFNRQLSDIMMEIHRAAKRTDIKRHDKNQRGFAHIAILADAFDG